MPSQFESKIPLNTFPNPRTHMVNTLVVVVERLHGYQLALSILFTTMPPCKKHIKNYSSLASWSLKACIFSVHWISPCLLIFQQLESSGRNVSKISIYYQQEALDNFVSSNINLPFSVKRHMVEIRKHSLRHSLSPNFKLISWAELRGTCSSKQVNNLETFSFTPRSRLSTLEQPVTSPLPRFIGFQTQYFLLAPIYYC